jgi:hypothetical protein
MIFEKIPTQTVNPSAKAIPPKQTPKEKIMHNEIISQREAIARMIEAEAERDARAIRKSSVYRIKPNLRRRDSRDRVRPRHTV